MSKMALIYIVEDDENIREIETIALKNSNYMVCAFEKAKDFYRKLEDIMPDLVLLDVMLPDESGYDIVRKLRKDPTTRQLPIIMVTAKTAATTLRTVLICCPPSPSLCRSVFMCISTVRLSPSYSNPQT